MTQRIDNLDLDPFLSGPVEFLAKTVAAQIRAVKQFKLIFGEFVDPYMRRDYPDRNLPCLRVYNEDFTKDSDDSWIDGDLQCDVIFPPLVRRKELQQFQDTLTSALLQQFRRTDFFNAVTNEVPGLNQLGKIFSVDKSLGFEWNNEMIVPLTQITVNFRLDLRAWDAYLEANNRTKEDPFEYTLANLERLYLTTQLVDDSNPPKVDFTVGPDHVQG